MWSRFGPCALLILTPILVLWPELAGLSQDPMLPNAGLSISGRGGWIGGASSLDLNVGVTTQALGHLSAEQWLAGRIPWWNPFNGLGMPLAGEMQASALFLPFVLLLHFQCGPLLLKAAMQMVAGVATFGLLRQLGLSRLVALTGGLVFELGGSFAWLGHGPIMPIAFLPLFLWGIERAVIGRGLCMIALAVGFSITAGFPETAYLNGLLALLWAIWRVVGAAQPWTLMRRIGLGGLAGLALAAPALWSFAHFLLNGTAFNHDSGAVIGPVMGLPGAGAALLLFPYLHGPLLAASQHDPSEAYNAIAPFLGGYLGLGLLVPALIGCLGRSRRGLRVVLAGWILLCLGRTLAIPGPLEVMDHIPLLARTLVPRYAVASWIMAAIVLASLALEDARHGRLTRAHIAAGAIAAAGSAAVALAFAWPLTRTLLQSWPAHHLTVALSLGWGLCSALGIAAALALGRRRLAVPAISALLVLDACLMFTVPLLSGVREGRVDLAAVAFLRDHAGLQRFYALGPYRPNYGAFFQTAQLNHEYLPLPANWVDHIARHLDPGAHPVFFRGDEPRTQERAQAVRDRRGAFAALAVRYVVAPTGQNPFLPALDISGGGAAVKAYQVGPGDSLTGVLTPPSTSFDSLGGFGVTIGTQFNTADGELRVTVCDGDVCAEGQAPLSQAADNQIFTLRLDHPLALTGRQLRWRVTHIGGRVPVAIWLSPEPTLRLEAAGTSPSRVYRDQLIDIYELPEASPYFQVQDGACDLEMRDRENLTAHCTTPATLIRRELFFSGWRARLNGEDREIAPFDEVLQSITLPAGRSDIRFSHAPPYSDAAILACLGACAGLAFSALRDRARARRVRHRG